jgi:hypothetical protein
VFQLGEKFGDYFACGNGAGLAAWCKLDRPTTGAPVTTGFRRTLRVCRLAPARVLVVLSGPCCPGITGVRVGGVLEVFGRMSAVRLGCVAGIMRFFSEGLQSVFTGGNGKSPQEGPLTTGGGSSVLVVSALSHVPARVGIRCTGALGVLIVEIVIIAISGVFL